MESTLRPRRGLAFALLLALLVGALTPAWALAAVGGQVPDNVAPWVAEAQLKGRANPSGQITVSLYLRLRDEAGLRRFISNVNLPGTPEYGRFLTAEQFRAAYAPA